MEVSEVPFLTFYCDFLPFERLEGFRLHQNFVNYSQLTQESIYSSAKQANPFVLPSILINFIENHSCECLA